MTAYNLQQINVLVIDGHQMMRRLMHDILATMGVQRLEVSASGDVDQFEDFHPDVIFADWSPGCDGLALSKQIRWHRRKIDRFSPIVMVSAYTELRQVCEARDAGVTEFLAKPFTATLIYRRICAMVENPRDFVDTRTYFGPDRRRRVMGPTGPERRIGAGAALVGGGRSGVRPPLHELVR